MFKHPNLLLCLGIYCFILAIISPLITQLTKLYPSFAKIIAISVFISIPIGTTIIFILICLYYEFTKMKIGQKVIAKTNIEYFDNEKSYIASGTNGVVKNHICDEPVVLFDGMSVEILIPSKLLRKLKEITK